MTTKTQLSTTGFQRDVQGYWIEKDPESQLIYTLDWSEWLLTNDEITSVQYTVSPTDHNDDINIVSQGISLFYTTFVELEGGVVNTTYTVTALITTQSGFRERRAFRIKVKNRQV
jgi:hypothetical protein